MSNTTILLNPAELGNLFNAPRVALTLGDDSLTLATLNEALSIVSTTRLTLVPAIGGLLSATLVSDGEEPNETPDPAEDEDRPNPAPAAEAKDLEDWEPREGDTEPPVKSNGARVSIGERRVCNTKSGGKKGKTYEVTRIVHNGPEEYATVYLRDSEGSCVTALASANMARYWPREGN